MIQNINSTQNNMTFGGKLVPIKEYKGTPKLSRHAIDGIKYLKKLIARTDSDIITLEGNLARNRYKGLDKVRLSNAIEFLKNSRDSLEKAINKVRMSGIYKPDIVALMENGISKILKNIADLYLFVLKR